MNNDDITVVKKYDTKCFTVVTKYDMKWGKGKKVKHSSSECHLGEGNDHGNFTRNVKVVWKWKNCYSTEISLLLKFGSSLQYNRKLVSYGTL